MVSTLCLAIISLKIWPPVNPTKELSRFWLARSFWINLFLVALVPLEEEELNIDVLAGSTLKAGDGAGLETEWFLFKMLVFEE